MDYLDGDRLQLGTAGRALHHGLAAVLAGTVLGHDVTVVFPPLELAVLGAAAIMAAFVTADGEATWIEGLELVAIYILAGSPSGSL